MPPIFNKEFIQKLDDWLAWNRKTDAQWIARKKGDIPAIFKQQRPKLYRGMIVDSSFIEKLDVGITFDDVSSWTKQEKIAKKFAEGGFGTHKPAKIKDGIKIIITKNITSAKIILDIHSFVLFTGGVGIDEMSVDSALKEEEVLVDKGIKIKLKDIQIIG